MNLFSIIRMVFKALVKPKQLIMIKEIPNGRILDIGGGGEGGIAQVGGTRVFAVDKFMSEIREAKDKALNTPWMVADAANLPYQRDCFNNATAFFSCMYMSEDDKENVFREIRRVLKKGGEFWVWDVNMSPRSRLFATRLRVDFQENRSINTVYGVKT